MTAPLLDVRDLRVSFAVPRAGAAPWRRRAQLQAVAGVGFTLLPGQTLGIVGESGCGKSTLARALMGLVPAHGNARWHDGRDLTRLSPRQMLPLRRDIQMVFQDPLAALDPRMTAGQIIAQPLVVHHPGLSRAERRHRVAQMMEQVGLLPDHINRYPHEFSGGQCQRIGIARALILRPRLLICDEPVSALDVSIQAQIINLLMRLRDELGLAMIFIAHDLAVVRQISDRVMVLYLGKVMEAAAMRDIFDAPQHPYTQALLAAVPVPDPAHDLAGRMVPLRGDLPSPLNPPSGCVFRTRCPRAQALCAGETPELTGGDHQIACHFPGPPTIADLTRTGTA